MSPHTAESLKRFLDTHDFPEPILHRAMVYLYDEVDVSLLRELIQQLTRELNEACRQHTLSPSSLTVLKELQEALVVNNRVRLCQIVYTEFYFHPRLIRAGDKAVDQFREEVRSGMRPPIDIFSAKPKSP